MSHPPHRPARSRLHVSVVAAAVAVALLLPLTVQLARRWHALSDRRARLETELATLSSRNVVLQRASDALSLSKFQLCNKSRDTLSLPWLAAVYHDGRRLQLFDPLRCQGFRPPELGRRREPRPEPQLDRGGLQLERLGRVLRPAPRARVGGGLPRLQRRGGLARLRPRLLHGGVTEEAPELVAARQAAAKYQGAEELLKGGALRNGRLRLCNRSGRPLEIDWLAVVYLQKEELPASADAALAGLASGFKVVTYNSGFCPRDFKLTLAPGAEQAVTFGSQDARCRFDGEALFFALVAAASGLARRRRLCPRSAARPRRRRRRRSRASRARRTGCPACPAAATTA